MRQRLFGFISALLSLSGCTNAPIKTSAGRLTQARVDAIIKDCGGFPGMAIIKESQITIYKAEDPAVSVCVLRALHATGETTLPSVGNQRYDVPAKD